MTNVIFITGATGNIGARLTARILKDDPACQLFILVRALSKSLGEQRVIDALQTASPELDPTQALRQIQIVLGDITLKNFGLSESEINSISSKVTHIIHSAGATQFNLPLHEERLINCSGAKNLIAFAKRAKRLGPLQGVAHLSTAYVCGGMNGTIYEDEPPKEPLFANSYEQSKWESEQYVRSMMPVLPISIFRPSVVVGDSETGRLIKFNVLYTPIRFFWQGYVKAIHGSPDAPLDVVPVDFVADAIHHIFFKSKQPFGKTFHIVAGKERATTAGEVVNRAVDYINFRMPHEPIAKVNFLPNVSQKCSCENMITRSMKMFEPYIRWHRCFDTTNTEEALHGSGIMPPKLSLYFDNILSYYLENGWRRRAKCAA